jgi:hypothetical protein
MLLLQTSCVYLSMTLEHNMYTVLQLEAICGTAPCILVIRGHCNSKLLSHSLRPSMIRSIFYADAPSIVTALPAPYTDIQSYVFSACIPRRVPTLVSTSLSRPRA